MDEGKLCGSAGGVKAQSEVPALAGGSEGSGGGGDAEGVCSDVHGGVTPLPAEIVYVKFNDQWCRYIVVSRHPELGVTLTIANGIGTAICRQSEAVPEEEHLRSIFLKQQAKAREKYEKLIALWNSGVTEASKLAEPLNTTRLGACSMIAAAKRWELISDYPLQTYK